MANIKYFVVDERKCGKGDNYNSDKKYLLNSLIQNQKRKNILGI